MIPPLPLPQEPSKHLRALFLAALFVLIFLGVSSALASTYRGRVYPGVRIGSLAVGGMTPAEVRSALTERVERIVAQGIEVQVKETRSHLSLENISQQDPDLSRTLVSANVDAVMEMALQKGRGHNSFMNILLALVPLVERPRIVVPVALDAEELSARLAESFPAFHEPAAPTRFAINKEGTAWNIQIVPGEDRQQLSAKVILDRLMLAVSTLDAAWLATPVEVPLVTVKPRVSPDEARLLIPEADATLARAPYHLRYTSPDREEFAWELSAERLASMLLPTPSGVDLEEGALEDFLDTMAREVNITAEDARMEFDGVRVKEFRPSREGRELDRDETRGIVRRLVGYARDGSAFVVVRMTQPTTDVEDVNTLGIKEVLGTGISSYAGSPGNRIKNIANGARLLNGILIAPGETFSLLSALRPFNTENGYLPELVIKGDRIIPEIGGGLCQIGTTTFRAVMNSGLPIVARQNHSLVVTYYNDPANGNPGTDATIYDPWPDFKFLNDTGNYLLFVTENDVTKKELRFSFWGTRDGRKGSYSPPIVEKWIPAGATREIKTTDLAPGVRQCQSAHPGAVASFVYTVEKPDGTKEDRTFTSSYRPLPTICLVGVEKTDIPPLSPYITPEVIPTE
ncbi:VanW family protein [Candidatus Uhrbacteria bacterium]|nr:VanW family protein [Candidatus Uhrbacteria bacterium]